MNFTRKINGLMMLFLMVAAVTIISSCTKDEEDITAPVTKVYEGVFQNSNGFQSIDYTVTVTKVDYHTIKVTPEDSNGTAFESVIIVNALGNQVDDSAALTFSTIAGKLTLSYNRSGEQFTGTEK